MKPRSASPISRGVRRYIVARMLLALIPPVAPVAAQQPRVERDVVYSEGGPDQVLDLYTPPERGFPTVIFVHGGSLEESGERRSSELYAHVCEPFVAEGIGCATIDYRLAPTHRWPAMPDDVAAAVRWGARQHRR